MGLLDQVLRALSPEPWAEHERRAGTWIRDLDDAGAFHRRHTSPEDQLRQIELAKRRSTEITARFKQTEPSVVGSALLLMIRRAKDGVTPAAYFWHQPSPLDFAWEVTRSDALLAGSVAAGLRREWFEMAWAVDWVVTMLERTGGAASTPADDLVVDGLLQWVDGLGVGRAPTDWRVALRRRIAGLRRAPDADLDLSGLYDVDSWSSSVVAELRRSDDPEQTSSLVRLVVDAKGSKPGPQWLTRAREVLAASTARDGLRHMLTALVDAPVARGGSGWSAVACVVAPDNADVARATTWAASQVEEAWVVPTLHAVADRGLGAASRRVVDPNVDPFSGDKIFNGAILALGLVGTPEAVAALQRLSLATRHNGIRTRIHAALGSAAERSGLTRGQLVERMVPTEDFGPDGIRAVGAEPGTARLVLEHGGAVRLEWQSPAGWSAKVPCDTDKDVVSAARRELKAVRAAVAAERVRLEGLLAVDRRWTYDEWCRYYRDHPITGRLAAALIWTFVGVEGAAVSGMPTDDDQVVGPHRVQESPADCSVALWHPATATTDEVQAWRSMLMDSATRQPFPQAFREIYVLTPAERDTHLHSNRFAAHVVRYQQMFALTKERAWVANYLGPYDGGYDGAARRSLGDVGLTAVFQHYAAEEESGAVRVDHAVTDRVWFYRTTDRLREPVPLEEVPPLAFSEAMRDVDLFVGVCSIALDPTWGLRQTHDHYAYWNRAAFGDLTSSGEVRRDVLRRIVPKLTVHDRVEVLDRYVRVRGELATYRIHLGSANVLIEPDDRYVCIVPDGRAKGPRVLLPFEGDEVLTVILSKIVLLAADDAITDETILQQIRHR